MGRVNVMQNPMQNFCLVNSKIYISIFYREKFHPSKTEGAYLKQAFKQNAWLLHNIQRYFSSLLFIKSSLRGRKICVVDAFHRITEWSGLGGPLWVI